MTGTGTIVIGGGIIGCLVAREIAARAPAQVAPASWPASAQAPVTLLEADAVGAGASRRSAGLHLPRGATRRVRRMSAYSHAYYADLASADPSLPVYQVPATLVIAPGHEDLRERYLPEAALTPASAPADLRVTLPDGATAYRVHGAHYSDVGQLTRRLAHELAQDRDPRPRVAVTEGVAVTALHAGDDAVTVECGTGQRLTAAHVVLAPGPWLATPAWRDLIAPLGLRVKRIVALHVAAEQTQPTQPTQPGQPGQAGRADEAVLFDSDDAFLLPLPDRGHWLFSYSCQEWDPDPDAPAAGLTAAHLRAATGCLGRYSPQLAGRCQGGRVFCDAYSPAGEPVVRAVDPAGRIIFAGAAGGSGYRLGPAIAAEAADLLAQSSEGVTGDPQQVWRGHSAPLLRH